MADVKQAAKWLLEGNRVRRAGWLSYCYWGRKPYGSIILDKDEDNPEFRPSDLLAEDWEVCK